LRLALALGIAVADAPVLSSGPETISMVVGGGTAPAVGPVIGEELAAVHLTNGVEDEPGEVVFTQPFGKPAGRSICWSRLTAGSSGSCADGPGAFGPELCATGSMPSGHSREMMSGRCRNVGGKRRDRDETASKQTAEMIRLTRITLVLTVLLLIGLVIQIALAG
jgi:hypothetical protein